MLRISNGLTSLNLVRNAQQHMDVMRLSSTQTKVRVSSEREGGQKVSPVPPEPQDTFLRSANAMEETTGYSMKAIQQALAHKTPQTRGEKIEIQELRNAAQEFVQAAKDLREARDVQQSVIGADMGKIDQVAEQFAPEFVPVPPQITRQGLLRMDQPPARTGEKRTIVGAENKEPSSNKKQEPRMA